MTWAGFLWGLGGMGRLGFLGWNPSPQKEGLFNLGQSTSLSTPSPKQTRMLQQRHCCCLLGRVGPRSILCYEQQCLHHVCLQTPIFGLFVQSPPTPCSQHRTTPKWRNHGGLGGPGQQSHTLKSTISNNMPLHANLMTHKWTAVRRGPAGFEKKVLSALGAQKCNEQLEKGSPGVKGKAQIWSSLEPPATVRPPRLWCLKHLEALMRCIFKTMH